MGKALKSGHGLMLSSLRTLLKQLSSNPLDDSATLAVRLQVRSVFEHLLTSATDKESALIELTATIAAAVVRRYRNPPAHGQFLRLDDAMLAFQHVGDALDRVTILLPQAT